MMTLPTAHVLHTVMWVAPTYRTNSCAFEATKAQIIVPDIETKTATLCQNALLPLFTFIVGIYHP